MTNRARTALLIGLFTLAATAVPATVLVFGSAGCDPATRQQVANDVGTAGADVLCVVDAYIENMKAGETEAVAIAAAAVKCALSSAEVQKILDGNTKLMTYRRAQLCAAMGDGGAR